MDTVLSIFFDREFINFLAGWQRHLISIGFAAVVWLGIVIHLLITGHASLGSNGKSDDIGCGDSRVWRLLVIFAGSAGLSFGLPYYWLKNLLELSGWLREYWDGFIYIQFATSVVQTALLILYSAFGPRKKWWRLLKAHLKGCGWVSALSPVGWIAYVVQQFLPNRAKILIWALRDIETIFVWAKSILFGPLVAICVISSLVGSVTHLKPIFLIPWITWIDKDHKEDEDSSAN